MTKTTTARTAAPSSLVEPIVVAEFWANRRGESIRVQLREYEGHILVDMRKHFTDGKGRLQATKKGLALIIHRLPELAAGINRALAKAQELGLIKTEAGQ
jgi:hypothetical protein